MIYRFGDCEIHTARFELRRGGVAQPVEPQVLRLLLFLIEHRDRVVTRDELFATIWEGRVVADSALYSRVKSARAAIGDQGAQPESIRTVSRMGYQFVASVHVGSEEARPPPTGSGGIAHAPAPQVMGSVVPRRHQQWWVAAAVAALGAVAWGYSGHLHKDSAATRDNASREQTQRVSTPSIAVLPLADLSPAGDQAHFVAGLVEDLTEQLARMPGLHVVKGRSPVGAQGAEALARSLGVEYLLEGSVRKAEDQLRITAKLLDTSGQQIWSRTYEHDGGDAFAIQREVAKAVAATFMATPDPAALDRTSGGTADMEAYEAYLAARAALVDPDTASPDDYRFARQQLRHAVAVDPQFAVAHAWLALSYVGTDTMPERHSSEFHQLASEASARALQLAPEQPWALLARARLLMRERAWAEAEKLFLRLQDASPLVESRWNCLACFYMMVGRIDEAVKRFELAHLMDPQLATNVLCAGIARAFAGDAQQFRQTFEQAATLYGDEVRRLRNRAFVSFALPRTDLVEAVQAMSPARGSLHDRMLANLNDPQAALAELRTPGRFPAPYPAYHSPMATWAAHFGDPRLALHFLELSAGDSSASYSVWHPVFAEARRLPEFAAVASKFGLIDYWRESGHWPKNCRPSADLGVVCF